MSRHGCTSWVVAIAAGFASSAFAQSTPPLPGVSAAAKSEAESHRALGAEHYEQNRLAEAMSEYEKAYQLDPQGEFLFSMAFIESARANCESSIGYYQRFLATRPGANATKQATDAIAACEAILAAKKPTPIVDDGVVPAVPEPVIIPLARVQRTVTHPWYSDPIGDALVGAGAVSAIAGGALYLLARRDVAEADRGGGGGVTLPEYQTLADRAQSRQRYAMIAGGVGAALVAGGVVRFLVGDRRESVEVIPALATDGASVTIGMLF